MIFIRLIAFITFSWNSFSKSLPPPPHHINSMSKAVHSNGCSGCERYSAAVEEQKAKLTLLETRLKDVLRAYKLLAREKEALQAANLGIASAERVDATQQRRIADLEETVLQLTTICGRVEVERAADRETIARLEADCERLRECKSAEKATSSSQGLETPSSAVQQSSPVIPPTSLRSQQKELRNKACQTTATAVKAEVLIDSGFSKRSPHSTTSTQEKACQTGEEEEVDEEANLQSRLRASKSFETAVVSPFPSQRRGRSVSETVAEDEDDDDEDDGEDDDRHQGQQIITSSSTSSAPPPPEGSTSLFYVNELARRELELAEYKLRVREHECSIRELQWKYSNEKYRLQSRIADLELLNSNFMSHKATTSTSERSSSSTTTTTGTGTALPTSMSTVNVAYVRNVLTKLLETKDREQKAIMINALLTALNSFS